MSDTINHPPHYTFGKYEVMDVIEGWSLNFARGCVVKYVARAGRKDVTAEVQDLMKARWYLDREIQRLTGGVLQSERQFDSTDLGEDSDCEVRVDGAVRESAAASEHGLHAGDCDPSTLNTCLGECLGAKGR